MGSCEKLHGAVIDHVGSGETRVFREIKALGEELENYGKAGPEVQAGFEGSFGKTPAKAALYFDWNNWWAIHQSAGPSTNLNYLDELYRFYRAFHRANIPVDIVGPEDDLEKYKILAAPVLYMVPGTDALSSISKICGTAVGNALRVLLIRAVSGINARAVGIFRALPGTGHNAAAGTPLPSACHKTNCRKHCGSCPSHFI